MRACAVRNAWETARTELMAATQVARGDQDGLAGPLTRLAVAASKHEPLEASMAHDVVRNYLRTLFVSVSHGAMRSQRLREDLAAMFHRIDVHVTARTLPEPAARRAPCPEAEYSVARLAQRTPRGSVVRDFCDVILASLRRGDGTFADDYPSLLDELERAGTAASGTSTPVEATEQSPQRRTAAAVV